MADNSEREGLNYLKDMNGNSLREGDLVLVILEKPVLVGFITKISEPSVLTKEKRPCVMTVSGQVSIPFAPRQIQMLPQTVKLVDPRAESLVSAIAEQALAGRDNNKGEDKKEASDKTGPSLVLTDLDTSKDEV